VDRRGRNVRHRWRLPDSCWPWDHVLAERSSFFNLPARKEGIIPGVSNMRLWRFVGDRAARQAILFDRQFPADSAAGQLICDSVVEDGAMDGALERTVQALTSSGGGQCGGNRKAIRVGQESIRSVPPVHGGGMSRAGVLSLQSAADRQSRIELERRSAATLTRDP